MTADAPTRWRFGVALVLGWVGGAAWGVVDVLAVGLGGALDLGPASWIALLLFGGLAPGIPAGLFAASVSWPAASRRWGAVLPLLAGVAFMALLAVTERWFTDPPPFKEPWPLQGQPVVYGLGILLAGVVAVMTLRALARPRFRLARWGLVAVVALAGAVRLGFAIDPLSGKAAVAQGPNLLLITLDTTRADRFESSDLDTPTFDRLARDGVRFSHAFAQLPVTGPSHASILTGRAPWENRMLLNGDTMPPMQETLATRLAERGYDTGAFVSAYVLNGNLGFSRGFSVYDDDFGFPKGLTRTLVGKLLAGAQRRLDPHHIVERRASWTVADGLSWVERQEGPWFLWVHLFDAHAPYEPPPPYDERYYRGQDPRDPNNRTLRAIGDLPPYIRPSIEGITDVDYVVAQYDGEVAFADVAAGRLLSFLDQRGLTDETVIAMAGDHGESLGERGEWFQHGAHLSDAALRVPLVIRYPFKLGAGRVVSAPVELTDLGPTLLDLLGEPPLEGATGFSLLPLIDGEAAPRPYARALALDQTANRARRKENPDFPPTFHMASVRTAQDRVLVRQAPELEGGWWRYVDGREQRDFNASVSDPYALVLRDAAAELIPAEAWERDELSDSDREMLEALGYTEGDEDGLR